MAWDDAPPTKAELNLAKNPIPSWDDKPPTPEELNGVQAQSPGPQTSQGMAALEHFGNPMGYLPKLQAAAEPITDRINNVINYAKGKPTVDPAPMKNLTFSGDDYDKSKIANIQRQDQEVRDWPITSVVSGVGGAIAQGAGINTAAGAGLARFAPGAAESLATLQKAKGILPALGRIGLAGTTAAAQGAAYDPGQISPEDSELAARGKNALSSGLLGAGAQALGETVRAGSNAFKSAAQKNAIKTAGPTAGDVKKLVKSGDLKDVADFMLENKIPSSDLEDVVDKAENIRKTSGKTIGSIYDKVLDKQTDQSFIDSLAPEAADSIKSNPGYKPVTDGKALKLQLEQQMTGKADGDSAFKRVSGILDDFAKKGDNIIPQDANDMKGQLDHLINYNQELREMPLAQQGLKQVRDYIKQATDEQIQSYSHVLNSDDFSKLKQANSDYGKAITVKNMAQGASGREIARNWLSPSEKGAAGLGAIYGLSGHEEDDKDSGLLAKIGKKAFRAGTGALIAGGVTKLGNNFSSSTKANVYNSLSNLAPKIDPNIVGTGIGLLNGQYQNNKQNQGLIGGQNANSR